MIGSAGTIRQRLVASEGFPHCKKWCKLVVRLAEFAEEPDLQHCFPSFDKSIPTELAHCGCGQLGEHDQDGNLVEPNS